MTTTQLKADLESAKAFIESMDASLPGAAKANALLDQLTSAAENPIALAVLSAVLTAKGF